MVLSLRQFAMHLASKTSHWPNDIPQRLEYIILQTSLFHICPTGNQILFGRTA